MFNAAFSGRHTAADAAASQVLAFRNPQASKKRVILREVNLSIGFDGTGAAAALGYELVRFKDPSAFPTNGAALGRVAKRTGLASELADADLRFLAGVLSSAANGLVAGSFGALVIPQTAGASSTLRLSYRDSREILTFEPNEGFLIRLAIVAAAGLDVGGSIDWDEVGR